MLCSSSLRLNVNFNTSSRYRLPFVALRYAHIRFSKSQMRSFRLCSPSKMFLPLCAVLRVTFPFGVDCIPSRATADNHSLTSPRTLRSDSRSAFSAGRLRHGTGLSFRQKEFHPRKRAPPIKACRLLTRSPAILIYCWERGRHP